MESSKGFRTNEANPIAERILLPRYLCLLQQEGEPAMIIKVDDWLAQHKGNVHLSYVFVAYTAEQFRTSEDLRVLYQMADAAARNAGVQAFWLGCSCMPDQETMQDDVCTICCFYSS